MNKSALFLALTLSIATALPARATGDIDCKAVDGSDAELTLNIGTLPVLNILAATIVVNDTVWSTNPGKGEIEIIVGQAAEDGNLLIADFTDTNVLGIVASLRLLQADARDDFVRAGTLEITGTSAHGMLCVGP